MWESSDVLAVPSSALFQRGGSWAVFAVENGRARLRRVEIGHRTGASVEIADGLKAGEKVVLFPSDKIDNGSKVR